MAVFEDVYQAYGTRVYRFLLTLTADESLAEELLQETFYQVFLHIDQFEGRSSLYTWICQIAKNAWCKEYKRKQRFVKLPDEETLYLNKTTEHNTEHSMEEEVARKDQCRRIMAIVNQLEELYRDVFLLHVYGEIKLKEIAAAYGKSESWAKVTYLRAKKKILQEVEE